MIKEKGFSHAYQHLPCRVLAPSNSSGSACPFLKSLILGYPVTSNRFANSVSTVASTLAIRMPSSFKSLAAAAYSGSSALQ